MKGLETGKDKVRKICEVLKKDTLDPARREAEEIVAAARAQAEEMVEEARRLAQKMHYKAKEEIEKERAVFQASLSQACRQTLEILKQTVEEKLFNHELAKQLGERMRKPEVLSALITAVVHAIEKEGIDTDISAFIPAAVPAAAVNAFLTTGSSRDEGEERPAHGDRGRRRGETAQRACDDRHHRGDAERAGRPIHP